MMRKLLNTIVFNCSKKFYDYVDKNIYLSNELILIRDLCMKQDSRDSSFSIMMRLFYCVLYNTVL